MDDGFTLQSADETSFAFEEVEAGSFTLQDEEGDFVILGSDEGKFNFVSEAEGELVFATESVQGPPVSNAVVVAAVDEAVAAAIAALTLDKSLVGLSNVDNTSDANKPISTAVATALAGKETAGAAAAITKATLGLGSVDNTSDMAKPVSTAQANAIAALKLWTAYTASLPAGAGVMDFTATVTDGSVLATSTLELQLAATTDADENEPEFTSIASMSAKPATGSFELNIVFTERHSGPLKLQYRIN